MTQRKPMTAAEQRAFTAALAVARMEARRRGIWLMDDQIFNVFWNSLHASLITPLNEHLAHAHDKLDLARFQTADLTVRHEHALQLCDGTPDVELDELPQRIRWALTTDAVECGAANHDGTQTCNRLAHPGDPQHAVIFYEEQRASLLHAWHDVPEPSPAPVTKPQPSSLVHEHNTGHSTHRPPSDLARLTPAADPLREHLLLHGETGAHNMHDALAYAYHQFLHTTRSENVANQHTEPVTLHPWAHHGEQRHG